MNEIQPAQKPFIHKHTSFIQNSNDVEMIQISFMWQSFPRWTKNKNITT